MASIKLKGDTSGELTIQAPSVAGTNTLNLPASSGTLATTAQASIGMKNRIINGNMTIDQRNAGASITPTSTSTYTLDRYITILTQSSKFSVQQNAGSVTPPVGFTNYLGATSLAATTLGSGDYFLIAQWVEGFNVADLGWGTANAKTITISFWVRSSLTGTFGGALNNSSNSRSYPYSYTISSADTWEKKSITVPGDTTGTWLTTNAIGIKLRFGLGVGSTFSGTAGSWAGSNYFSATGATSVVGTSGATLYITGVQLETGTTATDFENLQYGQQLALCQRYYQLLTTINIAGYSSGTNESIFSHYPLKMTMRAAPTINITSTGSTSRLTSLSAHTISENAIGFWVVASGAGFAGVYGLAAATASSEL